MNGPYLTSTAQIKRARSILSNDSRKSSYLDGLSLSCHKVTIADRLKGSNKIKPLKLTAQHFPLINAISKRKILNNSNSLVKHLLRYNKTGFSNLELNVMLSQDNNNIANIINYPKLSLKKPKKKIKNHSYSGSYSLAYQQKLERERKVSPINDYTPFHDTNFFNREYFIKDPTEFYSLNAYKMNKLIDKDHFVNKIKKDIAGLKFNQTLRAFDHI